MINVHYMRLGRREEDRLSCLDRVGGLPSYLPKEFPRSAEFGTEYCFLMQIVSLERFGLAGASLQLYQSGEVDKGDDPRPIVLLLPIDAPFNIEKLGRECEMIERQTIEWETGGEGPLPTSGVSAELMKAVRSKAGGVPPFVVAPRSGLQFIGQISEAPFGFNFGGSILTLWRQNGVNEIVSEFA